MKNLPNQQFKSKEHDTSGWVVRKILKDNFLVIPEYTWAALRRYELCPVMNLARGHCRTVWAPDLKCVCKHKLRTTVNESQPIKSLLNTKGVHTIQFHNPIFFGAMQSLRKKLLNEASLHGSCTLIYQMDIFCNGFNQSLRADSASPMNRFRRPEGILPTLGYGYDHNRLNQQHLPHSIWLPDSWNKDCFIPNLNKEYNHLTVVVIPK